MNTSISVGFRTVRRTKTASSVLLMTKFPRMKNAFRAFCSRYGDPGQSDTPLRKWGGGSGHGDGIRLHGRFKRSWLFGCFRLRLLVCNASEVVRAALRRLEDDEARLAALRSAIDEGESSPDVEDFNRDVFLAELKAQRK